MARKPEIIVATDHDFAVLRGDRPFASARWDEVRRIVAYKRDEFTTDLICLDVELRTGTTVVVHEEMPGWEKFLDVAERALPGMRSYRSWFPGVARPPFALCAKVIFEHDVAAP